MLQKHEVLSMYPWMDEQLFARIIQKDYPNASEINVKDFSVKSALPPGENYASQMIRATVSYEIDGDRVDKGFIIKAMFTKPELLDIVGDIKLFEKEIRMFRDIIPELEKLLASVGDETKFAARCYDHCEEKEYIILEDLTLRGYRNADRRLGLDVDHYKRALTKIAKYHACTAILYEKKHPFPNMNEPTVLMDICQEMSLLSLKAAADVVQDMPKFKHLSEKILKTVDTVIERTKYAIKGHETDFMTLCHGDLWMNNIMFKFDKSGSPEDAILCDYQIPYVGPAVMDIINVLFTSSANSVRDRDWDVLVQHYHGVLAETLQKLNYPKAIPTLTSIHVQILEKGVCYIPMALSTPGIRTLENTGEDMTSFMDIVKLKKILSAEKGRTSLEFLLDYFDRKGYFD